MKKALSILLATLVLLISYLEYCRRTDPPLDYKDPNTRLGLEFWGLCKEKCAVGAFEQELGENSTEGL